MFQEIVVESKLPNQIRWSWFHSFQKKMFYPIKSKHAIFLNCKILKIRRSAFFLSVDTKLIYLRYLIWWSANEYRIVTWRINIIDYRPFSSHTVDHLGLQGPRGRERDREETTDRDRDQRPQLDGVRQRPAQRPVRQPGRVQRSRKKRRGITIFRDIILPIIFTEFKPQEQNDSSIYYSIQ